MQKGLHDAEHAAVRHILTAPLLRARTAPFVLEDDFDWERLRREAETMSGGEELLLRIGRELWTAEKAAGLWEIPRRLDGANFRRVLEALSISHPTATPLWELTSGTHWLAA